jgi:hypothetical protein
VTDDLTDEMAILRATSDQLVQAIVETDARERRKRGMRPADPSFVEFARAVRIAAEVVLELARQEERTAVEIVRESTTATLPPIEAMHPARELASILEEWRAIEQRMNTAEPGSAEAESLMMEFERLRDSYAQALKTRRKDG